MNIGILTFHRSYNYGAFTQCFSLVKRLQRELPEHNIEVIDYSSKKAIDSYDLQVESCKDQKKQEFLKKRNEAFKQCQQSLPLSDLCEISDDYTEMVKYMNDRYDAVIVGSDAVFNWVSRGFPNLYFLKDYKGIKFSYAASAHGMVYQNMTDEQKKYLDAALGEFKYIGVRDTTTEDMVRFVNRSTPVYHNCDPTMFLDLNDVPCDMDALKEKMIAHGVDFSKPLIGLMAGNSIGREIKKKYGDSIQLVALYEPNKYADVYLYDLTPFEWAHVFSFFKLTFTHFFHGTLLSLANGVPVIPIEFKNDFSAVNKTKILDVMTRLGLADWRMEADYRNQSIIVKAMRKFGLYCDRTLWNKAFKLADDFLQNDYSSIILDKRKKEAESFDSFIENLKKYI